LERRNTMGKMVLTDELLDFLGEEYEKMKTGEIMSGIYSEQTFQQYVEEYRRELESSL
jgi:hypothetical protein